MCIRHFITFHLAVHFISTWPSITGSLILFISPLCQSVNIIPQEHKLCLVYFIREFLIILVRIFYTINHIQCDTKTFLLRIYQNIFVIHTKKKFYAVKQKILKYFFL